VIALVVVASLPPAPSSAIPVSPPPKPVSAELLDAVRTGHPLAAPFTVAFAAPMEPASVAAAVRISPDAPVRFGWDAAGKVLTIAPLGHWSPDTLYLISVADTARAADGGALETPVRALVLTAHAGTGLITATRPFADRVRTDTAFRIVLDRQAGVDAIRTALRTEPAIPGSLTAGDAANEYLFSPAAVLAPGTRYRVWMDGLADSDGVPFAATPALDVTTVGAPSVVRFRPVDGAKQIDRAAAISVRFTEGMQHKRTGAAFHATIGGTAVTGTIAWAEKDRVLVFRPASALPYGATVRVTLDATALSTTGVPVAAAASGTFTVVPKPAPPPPPPPKPKAKPAPAPTKTISHSGGSGAVSGTWHAVETYYLKLMNCTRTGGWVTSTGSCSSPGGRSVAPLSLSDSISSRVSRPYAKLLATRGICNHFIGGTPGDRLRRAGFTSYRWAENLGCRSGNPYSAVLGSHLFFQSEKPYSGGHFVNLMNAAYDRAGIGVWVASGRVRLVVDFYHP
jgi:uncharacterized protein YkwD